MKMEADVVIVGTGVGGLFSALSLPRDRKIIMITKSDLESSDSFLAQGGICMLHDKDDYDSYFEDTMKAGIHPDYQQTTIRCACGNVIETGSTKQDIRVEVCSKCHPFYTGKQKMVDTGGRVSRFNKKFGLDK